MLVRDLATALDGHGGISGITLNDDYTLTFTMADETTVTTTSVRGATGAKGDKGTDGRAITSVTKTDTSGLVDTYKIQFSDNTSTTFTVTNGASIKSVAKTGTSGLVDTYTVTLTDNTTSTFTVTNGNGIASITLQSGTHAAGTTDVYKITFDNGQYTTFSVYNGLNGSGSVATVNDKLPDASGNVSLAATDVGAPTVEEFNTLETTVGGKQPTTNSLGTETDLADGDFIPFYDTSASANKKTLWSNIVAKIRTALFGSANGFLKADGSGNISAEGSIKTADLADGAVSRANLAQDALISPNVYVAASRKLQARDLGKKLFASGNNNNCVLTLDDAASAEFEIGSEIFFGWINASSPLSIKFSGVNFVLKGSKEVNTSAKDVTVKLVEQGSAASIIKYNNVDGAVSSRWFVTGDVEVVT